MKTVAIVLAAGKGKRMKSDAPKQYLMLKDMPVLCYALKAFEESLVDEVILVTGREEIEYCRGQIVEAYGFSKVTQIVEGGKERYHSVYAGLVAAKDADYVFIHDGARPFVSPQMIQNLYEEVNVHGAVVAGMPVKDTIKLVDENQFVKETPNRKSVWLVQTPQVFAYRDIFAAYEKLIDEEVQVTERGIQVTDDAMVLETFGGKKVKLVETGYENIKITTPEDLPVARVFMGILGL